MKFQIPGREDTPSTDVRETWMASMREEARFDFLIGKDFNKMSQ